MTAALFIHLTTPVCATDDAKVLHATDALRRKTRRKTYDTKCGSRARLLAGTTVDGDNITIAWPPYVKTAREWGYERCCHCMTAAPGKPTSPRFAPASA